MNECIQRLPGGGAPLVWETGLAGVDNSEEDCAHEERVARIGGWYLACQLRCLWSYDADCLEYPFLTVTYHQ